MLVKTSEQMESQVVFYIAEIPCDVMLPLLSRSIYYLLNFLVILNIISSLLIAHKLTYFNPYPGCQSRTHHAFSYSSLLATLTHA